MKHINDLTEDCFLLLFSHIPLDELVKIREVCKIWFFIVRQICARKTSLKLFSSIHSVEKYAQHLLWYNLYDDKEFKLRSKNDKDDDELIGAASIWPVIGYLFPNVQKLVFYDKMNCFSLVLMSIPNLVTLTLRGPEDLLYNEESFEELVTEFEQLLPRVNNLKLLKNLNLFAISSISPRFSFDSSDYPMVTIPEMPILEQLDTFSLCNYGSDCLPVLDQLGPNLQKLNLKGPDIKFDDFKIWFLSNSQLFKNLSHLSIGSINVAQMGFDKLPKNTLEDKKLFHFICENFTQLKYFEFKFNCLFEQDEVLSSLAKLSNLTELKFFDIFDETRDANFVPIKLKSVKILHFTMCNGNIFPEIKFADIFSNLEELNIIGYENPIVYYNCENSLADLTCKINFIGLYEKVHYMGRYRNQWKQMKKERSRQQYRFMDDGDYDDDDDSDDCDSGYYYNSSTIRQDLDCNC